MSELPTAKIGEIVLFYRHADVKTEPLPAIVTGAGTNGVLSLTMFPRNARSVALAFGARWKDDPILKANEEVRIRSGCWDFRSPQAGDPPSAVEHSPAAKDGSLVPLEEDDDAIPFANIDDEILRLHAEGLNATEIAQAINAQGKASLTHQKVNAVVRAAATAEV